MHRRTDNKFVGPDHSAPIWYAQQRPQEDFSQEIEHSEPVKTDSNPLDTSSKATTEIVVEVWLFGLLSTLCDERPLKLRLAKDATLLDLVAVLEERFGSEILESIKDPVSGILPCCRVFVDGETFEDVKGPIAAHKEAASIELILVKGFEGG